MLGIYVIYDDGRGAGPQRQYGCALQARDRSTGQERLLLLVESIGAAGDPKAGRALGLANVPV
jgi:hypothetical protein